MMGSRDPYIVNGIHHRAIYPLGYYLTLLGPTATYHEQSVINIIYNIADLVNKLAFGLCIWGAAISDK